jgi:hypothetical protein
MFPTLYNFSLSNVDKNFVVMPESSIVVNGTRLTSQLSSDVVNPYVWSFKNGYIIHTPSGKYISAMGDGIVNLTLQDKLDNTSFQLFHINHETGRIFKKDTNFVFDFTGGSAQLGTVVQMWMNHNDNSDLPQKFNITYKLNTTTVLLYIILLVIVLFLLKRFIK